MLECHERLTQSNRFVINILYDFLSNVNLNIFSFTVQKLITPIAEAKRFMVDCFKSVGSSTDNADIIASNLIEADYRGHYSHGMNRLGVNNVFNQVLFHINKFV